MAMTVAQAQTHLQGRLGSNAYLARIGPWYLVGVCGTQSMHRGGRLITVEGVGATIEEAVADLDNVSFVQLSPPRGELRLVA